MGTWGHNPLDSDGALDWLGGHVTDHVGMEIRALLKTAASSPVWHCAEELRAAADTVTKLNFFSNEDLYGDLFGDLADALQRIHDDENYVGTWFEEEPYRESVTAQIAELRKGWHGTTLGERLDALGEGAQ